MAEEDKNRKPKGMSSYVKDWQKGNVLIDEDYFNKDFNNLTFSQQNALYRKFHLNDGKERWKMLHGMPARFLPKLASLLEDHDTDSDYRMNLRDTIDTIKAYGVKEPEKADKYLDTLINKQSAQNAKHASDDSEDAFNEGLRKKNKMAFIEGMAQNYINNESNPKIKDRSEKNLLEVAHGDWNSNAKSDLFYEDVHRDTYKKAILEKVNEIKGKDQSLKQEVRDEYAGMNPDQVIAHYHQKYNLPKITTSKDDIKAAGSKLDKELNDAAAAKLGRRWSESRGLY